MRRNGTLELTLAAVLCALCAVLAQIHIPLPPVPVSLALLAVHLCGALLGWRWGAAAVGCYVALGAVGLPVFAGFAGGVSVLAGPTGGFLAGYMVSAAVTGALTERLGFTRHSLHAAMAAGTLCCYALGTIWFCAITGTSLTGALSACVLPFIPGDLIKITLAAALCLRLRKPLRDCGLMR